MFKVLIYSFIYYFIRLFLLKLLLVFHSIGGELCKDEILSLRVDQ